jgi:regulator of replication initiation timing
MVEQRQADEPGGDLRYQLDEVLKECARLREENVRLRRTLGLPADPRIQASSNLSPAGFRTTAPMSRSLS